MNQLYEILSKKPPSLHNLARGLKDDSIPSYTLKYLQCNITLFIKLINFYLN